MSQGRPAAEAPPARLPRRRAMVALVAVMIPMVLATLDNTIIGTALPTVVGELGGLSTLSWVITSYTLATAASTPVWGKLADMYGGKVVFVATLVVFLAGSLLSGMAQSITQLTVFRAVHGLGAGGLMVCAFAIMVEVLAGPDLPKYQGIMSATMGLTMVAGPLVGGLITDELGWRWCFYINLPIGAVALLIVVLMMHLPRRHTKARVDYAGAALLTVVSSCVVLVTTWGGITYPWASPMILGLVALGVLTCALFVVVERRVAEPLVPLAMFRSLNFTLSTLIAFLVGFALIAGLTFLALFQQAVQGASASDSGLLLLPLLLSMAAVNVVGGRLMSGGRSYRLLMLAGAALMTLSLLLFALMDVGTSRTVTAIPMVGFGAGLGLLMQTSLMVALSSVEMRNLGVAASTSTLFRTIGGAVGASATVSLFSVRVQSALADRGVADAADLLGHSARLDAAGLAQLPRAVRVHFTHAVASGTRWAFLMTVLAGLICVAAAWFLRRVTPLTSTPVAPEPARDVAAPTAGSGRAPNY
ncbi:MFS transporter [Micromonospora sp. KC207]|uniref:MDR family MFS transporter n=1 Tax=Micromonospora sp. KC207 TaxID=2530377 RepID=UPI00104DE0A5|nr:MDR family MFS transporter [Micromonospora sp. KC207]TDC67354.1 MFS transporter [Micromonospora sp. KC207]